MPEFQTKRRFLVLCAVLALAAVACAPDADSAEQTSAAAEAPPERRPVEPAGQNQAGVSGGVFRNLNSNSEGPASVDLGQVLGTKPVILYYWIAGNPRADEMFQEVQALVNDVGGDRVALYGVALLRNEKDAAAIDQRVKSLGITVPVLNDEGFELGKALSVQSVPNLTIFDASGEMRLTNGASLRQELEYKLDVARAIRRVAETGSVGSYGYLAPYYPVKELVGQESPDFKAPLITNSVEQRWSSMVKSDALNVLIFWSVDCPHCRTSLPEINAWLKQNGDDINVITAAKVTNDESKQKTREFCDVNGFVFPTLVDQDLRIAQLYNVTSTPTILIIRPDGVIDSVITSGGQDFGATMQAKKKLLL